MVFGYYICGCDKNVYVLGFSSSYLGYFLRRHPRSEMTRMEGEDTFKAVEDFAKPPTGTGTEECVFVLVSLKVSEISPGQCWDTLQWWRLPSVAHGSITPGTSLNTGNPQPSAGLDAKTLITCFLTNIPWGKMCFRKYLGFNET